MKKRLLAAALAAVMTLGGCTGVAEMAGYNSAALNQEAAKSYRQVIGQARQQRVVDSTSRTAKRIQTVFMRLKPYAERANTTGVPFAWEMTVIRSEELNAWAMPGGKMAFYTGLAEKLNLTDDEIAAVVGHEMTHALNEHGKQEAGQKILTGLAVQLGGAVLQAKTGVSSDTLNLGAGLLSEYGINKPFSRSQEYEADAGGMRLMAQGGYNPEAALTVWEKMNRINDNNNALNAIVSTHPNNNARIEAMRRLLPEMRGIYAQSRR
ncbi:M48 family metallopeptidase [Neisseria leonii]|uniref:M48 family metallopeptidase n=1 Tax=Neisseria leonii TaxID=2995413 RepID=UPI00237A4564|nr:M48 family metallopeptidase [Neisseria sp. 3986]MDD9326331.1 M48 family metallopeptidase [Neisseria sp. 3986]